MKTKLLVVGLSLYNGGAEKSLVNFLNLLDYSQYEVDLLLFRAEGLFLKQVPEQVNIIDTPTSLKYCYVNIDSKGIKSATAIKSTVIRYAGSLAMKFSKGSDYKKRQYRWENFYKNTIQHLEKSYDVAMAYAHGEPSWYVMDKVNARKKILWVHNDYSQFKSDISIEAGYFSRADFVVSISEKCVDILKEFFPSLQNKFLVLPNLTSGELVRKMSNEYVPEEMDGTFTILSIGRLSKQKGFDYAIDAASILKDKGLKFKWLVLGDGELEDELNSQIKEKQVSDCFFLLGVRENPYVYIKNCDIFAQTSRFEGKSVVIDEAKILAKPILVTNYPTVQDQITNVKEGIIVDITPVAIAEGLESLIEDPDKRDELSGYLGEHEYGNQSEIDKYIALFKS